MEGVLALGGQGVPLAVRPNFSSGAGATLLPVREGNAHRVAARELLPAIGSRWGRSAPAVFAGPAFEARRDREMTGAWKDCDGLREIPVCCEDAAIEGLGASGWPQLLESLTDA